MTGSEQEVLSQVPKEPLISCTPKSLFVVASRFHPRLPKDLGISREKPRRTPPLMSVVFEMGSKELVAGRCVAQSVKRPSWETNGEIVTIRRSVKECVREMEESVCQCSVDCECSGVW